ncbi:MAG: AAA family ATPase [Acidimicrobiales bacterium]
MRRDTLEEAVSAFVERVGGALAEVGAAANALTPERARHDAAVEAFNVAAAFVDCGGRHTDQQIWALTRAFAPHLDTGLAGATPDQVRKAGLLAQKRRWLDAPSLLFDTLTQYDQQRGTAFGRLYYDRALAVAYSVAAADVEVTPSELDAIESFRANLGGRLKDPGALDDDSPARAAPGGEAPAGPKAPDPAAGPVRPLEELLGELDALVGMAEVKAEVKLVTNLLRVQQLRRERGLPVLETSRHLVFTGNPGTGKTTVARLLAQIYRTLGVVSRGQLVEVDRSALVAGFVGQTAPKVVAAFDRADEGVLLVDEAYALARGNENDFGQEAIDTLVKLIEDRRDRVVVIAAGYTDEMAEFIDSNPGLRSRFPTTIYFPDYSTEELVEIFRRQGDKQRYSPDAEALAAVRAVFDAQPRDKGFGNARLARNLFEAAVARQASRVVQLSAPSDEDLCRLTAADIPVEP